MSRPRLPIGTWGTISSHKDPSGSWRSSAYFRDFNGSSRRVRASGPSASAAERHLTAKLVEGARIGSGELKPTTPLATTAEMWLAEVEGTVGDGTLDEYKRLARKRIIPAIGELMLGEVTVGVVDRFLRAESLRTPAQARNVRSALLHIMAVALRHDAIRLNPVRESAPLPKVHKTPEALTETEVVELRDMVRLHRAGPGRSGPPPGVDLMDFVDLTLATGTRIGEALGLRWQDINLDVEPVLVTIAGTLVEATGVPVHYKNSPKTASGFRTLSLPDHAAAILKRRRASAKSEWVFATKAGAPRAPQNIHRTFREIVKDTELQWVTPHVLRKTVATRIARLFGDEAAAKQLGHSGPEVTRRHYIQKASIAPDVSETLSLMFLEPMS
ncbi:putative phage integrase [Salinibacterium xinjiangense]|uniref:Integrase n=1 Tax=Salinibacterium xinjiangense TaxID=386302 RepID=A0A2C8ZL58_9MICO|nr:site-specific integrase [Salinibacterium xinjiangense]GGK87566.1 putative phage integrase [Salinibacterium xinjiangense]SOE65731.1 Integrase [Salinibacterium xinjiangense]